eukprot:SAG11_NODE_1973_length_3979_cov_5.654897_4_plen_251_part_00
MSNVAPRFPPGIRIQRKLVSRPSYRSGYQRRYKRKYPRTGSRRIAMRPQSGRVVPQEVHRAYRESSTINWPKYQDMATAPSPAAIFVPNSYQSWSRGLADGDFTDSKVTLRNISLMVQMNAPQTVLSTMNTPHRLRVTAGWCKQNATVKMYQTTNPAILGQFPNGMAINQTAPSVTQPIPSVDGSYPVSLETVKDTIDDQVQILGVHQKPFHVKLLQYFILFFTSVFVLTGTCKVDPSAGIKPGKLVNSR